MEHMIGDRVYVKLSDADEYRGEIIDMSATHLYILDRNNRSAWVERRFCKRWSRYQ